MTIQQRPIPTALSTTPPPPAPAASVDEIPEVHITSPTTPGSAGASANGGSLQEKKVRGLLKKVRAIEDLKMRLAGGEKLEDTQMKKIHSEDSVKGELSALGYTA